MIIGVGTDLVEIERVVKACEKESFLQKYYTEKENIIIKKNINKAADNFTVKEALVKALGTGFYGIEPIEVEVLRDALGKPYVNLFGKALKKAEELGVINIHASISNTKKYANAFVVLEGE